MKKVSSEQLLKLTQDYLVKSLKVESRAWVLGSLISLAEEEDVTNPSSIKYPQFKDSISTLLNKRLSGNAWASWLEQNATVLQGKMDTIWLPTSEPGYIKGVTSDEKNDWIDNFISTNSKAPKMLSESSSSLLRGNGEIPSLYLFTGQLLEGLPPSSFSKALGHYDWLTSSISSIAGASFENNYAQNIETWVIGHKAKLDGIRRWFARQPKRLGGGADGVAWDIGERRILKIFSDRNAYQHALNAVDRLHKNPALAKTEAMIYDVGEIGNWAGRNIYYYVMEKMLPVSQLPEVKSPLREIIAAIVRALYKEREHWRDIKARDPRKDADSIRKDVKLGAERYANYVYDTMDDYVVEVEGQYDSAQVKVDKNDPKEHVVPLSQNWLVALAEEIIMKYLTGRTDLHLGNLGVTAYGEFRYFDPAYSKWTSTVNLPGANLEPSEVVDWGDVEF